MRKTDPDVTVADVTVADATVADVTVADGPFTAVTVVGGGLAGCEAAWTLARLGFDVELIEARGGEDNPADNASTPPWQSGDLAELVCSNSLKSDDPARPTGLLKRELAQLGSLLIPLAREHAVAAGTALAVDRGSFARAVTGKIASSGRIRLVRAEVTAIPEGPAILATGPLTRPALAQAIAGAIGSEGLYFYDAIAPVVEADSLDWSLAFSASRWGRDAGGVDSAGGDAGGVDSAGGDSGGEDSGGDYLNCPMNREEYEAFVEAIAAADKVTPRAFEEPRYFENCSPVELMVERGRDVLRYGPLRPIGLIDPRTGARPWAVVQLRMENRHRTAFNLVGCQTRMTYPSQERVFRLIPALREARFLRLGEVHRNTYVDAPRRLEEGLFLPGRPHTALSGLLCGVEGYVESMALGLYSALRLAARLRGVPFVEPPVTCALGALAWHIRHAPAPYMPTNVHLGLWPPLQVTGRLPKAEKRRMLAERAVADFDAWFAAGAGFPVEVPT
ncbi:MAG: methylenetetrahydrofolate--tRNA-(uracil(54)-C(5))-methyltransferase (FADH(2)-oxidizing) TrmFO [Deltaproteobacteria bacterium HGW-Deltaproteobacteria-22]|nr:MAG: methylenetetrahydrofolate--tRNA-(uracil(54)-C(5))-methyltransferase (FADH(2)-oxidizing) TrmFO [Deltaproteobacteria bacterium HGW-Deltaproteobacteria-22]